MLREELSQGSLRPKNKDKKAQIKLEKLRRDLIDLLGRVVDYGNPIESEERIRLIDLNVALAKQRSDAAKAATKAAMAKAQAAKAAAQAAQFKNAAPKTYIIGGPASDKKEKQKQVAKDDGDDADDESCFDCSEDSDCSMPKDDFEATLAPYIKETLQSSLNTRLQLINADCAAKGLPAPERRSVIAKGIAELRDRIAGGEEDDDDKFVTEIALKILDEFSISSKQKGGA